jgi:SnoaL-like domain
MGDIAMATAASEDNARLQLWCDKQEINELVQRWGLARDQGLWDELNAVYHPDARMTVSWFDGPASEFVNASRERTSGGTYNKHYLVGTVVDVRRTRAIAETNVFMVSQAVVHGIEVNAQGYFRFLDQVERRDGVWRIARRTAVYERDFMAPIDPVASLDLDPTRLASVPKAYRYMGYRFRTSGSKLREGIVIGGSADETALRAEYAAWFGG